MALVGGGRVRTEAVMTDLTLLPEDKQELGDAIDRAVASGDIDGKIKDSFCGCWPTVKAIPLA